VDDALLSRQVIVVGMQQIVSRVRVSPLRGAARDIAKPSEEMRFFFGDWREVVGLVCLALARMPGLV
jgi:hypothetical protein